ncbi:MAG: hypothetical protein DRJ40_01355 [Thermoprotei archaeon]|nr:MAG: hypothetical protein DRJ40_01355 [Thermoprotei archaeon]
MGSLLRKSLLFLYILAFLVGIVVGYILLVIPTLHGAEVRKRTFTTSPTCKAPAPPTEKAVVPAVKKVPPVPAPPAPPKPFVSRTKIIATGEAIHSLSNVGIPLTIFFHPCRVITNLTRPSINITITFDLSKEYNETLIVYVDRVVLGVSTYPLYWSGSGWVRGCVPYRVAKPVRYVVNVDPLVMTIVPGCRKYMKVHVGFLEDGYGPYIVYVHVVIASEQVRYVRVFSTCLWVGGYEEVGSVPLEYLRS